ncbi:MAG: serine protease [Desulfobacteraceae bacterium]|nr:MAG: serine protease [Desulfobacteraceae bacterium]
MKFIRFKQNGRFPWYLLLIPLIILCANAVGATAAQKIYVVPIKGEVDPGMAAFVARVHQEASKDPDALVIMTIDTFGGRLDSALEIVETLLKFPEKKTIAFVESKAISAGALISLACADLVMRPSTTIGDCAPIIFTQEGPEMMGEKFQSPIRAKFRALAQRNGYPEALTEAMVTPEKEVYAVEIAGERIFMDAQAYADLTPEELDNVASKKTIIAAGELLTMNAAEAMDYGFSRMTVDSIEEMLKQMGITDYEIVRIEEMWSETMVRFIGRIAPILMMIGLAALYMELKAPGFGLPGMIGIICLSVVFLNQYLVGLAHYTELLIILFGLALMGVEMFVLPGFGIAGFSAILVIAVGLVLTLQDFVVPDPSVPWQMEILKSNLMTVLWSLVGAVIAGILILRYVMPWFSEGREGPFLMSDLRGAHADSAETARIRMGDRGVAATDLRPSGKAEINDDIFDVITENEFLDRGSPVIVDAVRGNWIVVSKDGSS